MAQALGTESTQLVIKDCSGAVRAAGQTFAGNQNQILFRLKGKNFHGSVITLSSTDLAPIKLELRSESARVEDIKAAEWTACVSNPEVAIESVSINPIGAVRDASNSNIGSYAALGGGLLGAGLAWAGSSSNQSASADTATNSVNELVGGASPALNSNQSVSAPNKFAASEANNCLNNRSPRPISPFF